VKLIHILTSTKTILTVNVRAQESRTGDSAVEGVLSLKLKKQLLKDSYEEQQSFLDAGAIASYVSLNKLDQRQRFRASIDLIAQDDAEFNFTKGSSSSGLGYALALFQTWWNIVLNKSSRFQYPIFATGEILTSGQINPISHLSNKLNSACEYVEAHSDEIPHFYLCYPKQNDNEITAIQRKRIEGLGGIFIPSERLQDILGQLLGDQYDGDPLGRWRPFKGLNSFEYEDSVRFFGRDKDVQRLYDDLKQNSGLLIVAGASGTGKSSLIKAGLIPKLEKENNELSWFCTTPNQVNKDSSIIRFILTKLNKVWLLEKKGLSIEELSESLYESLDKGIELIRSHLSGDESSCLIYLDQYEEVFSQTEKDVETVTLELKIIDALAKQLGSLNIILALRNEYLGRLLDNQALVSPIISNVASKLSADDWYEIIHEQAAFSGIEFEVNEQGVSLDKIIINEAVQMVHALPMVEFLLEQLYEKCNSDKGAANTLYLKDYEEIGGLSGATAYRATKALVDCNADEDITPQLFDTFVGLNGESLPYARTVSLKQIEATSLPLYKVVQELINANIIVSIFSENNDDLVKLAHDSLFSSWLELNAWLEEHKEYLSWRYSIDGQFNRWKEAVEISNKSRRFLLKDKFLLDEGLTYLRRGVIQEKETRLYVTSSKKNKQKWQIGLVFGLLILPMMSFVFYQWDQNRIKSYYYSSIGERWGVPFGINKISDKVRKHRRFVYRLDYKAGNLISLRHENSFGTLVEDEHRNKNSLWNYSYTDGGQLHQMDVYQKTNKKSFSAYYRFDVNRNRAVVEFSKSFLNRAYSNISLLLIPKYYGDGVGTLGKTKSSISRHLLAFSNQGFLLKRMFQSPTGINIFVQGDYFGFGYVRNEKGENVEEHYLSYDMEKIKNVNGGAVSKYRYSMKGDVVETEKTNSNGKSNYERYVYDQFGNQIQTISLGENKKPKQYNAIKYFKHDESGNLIEVSILDADGKIAYSKYGIAKVKMKYDFIGRNIETSYQDSSGNLIINRKNNFARIKVILNADGNVIKTFGYNENNLLVKNRRTGCKISEVFYDEFQFEIGNKCYGEDNKLQLGIEGVAEVRATRDGDHIKELAYFGVEGEPMKNKLGAAVIKAKFDIRGNRVEETYYDIYGSLIEVENAYAKSTYSYDAAGNIIESAHWNKYGEIVILSGIAKYKKTHDESGREIESSFFGMNDQPALVSWGGYHRKVTEYSRENGFMITEKYFSKENVRIYPGIISHPTLPAYKGEKLYSGRNVRKIEIKSTPSSAKIFLNNRFVGLTPFSKKFPLGEYKLKIIKDNFNFYESEIDLNNPRMIKLNQVLIPELKENISNTIKNAELGDASYQNQLGNLYKLGEDIEKDYVRAVNWYELSAAQGNHNAMYNLGLMYQNGFGVKQNYDAAFSWLNKSATSGFDLAQKKLGEIFSGNPKVKGNEYRALKWFKMSAKQGNSDVQSLLCLMYRNGWGTKQNKEKAFDWCVKSANQGNAVAIFDLARMFEQGSGTEQNLAKAFYWYSLAAELKYSAANYQLGEAYFYGLGTKRDIGLAISSYKLEFDLGGVFSARAAGTLGLIYSTCLSNLCNYEIAAEWLTKSINADSKSLTFGLANLYLLGKGVIQDRSIAITLFRAAHFQGDKRATQWLTSNGVQLK